MKRSNPYDPAPISGILFLCALIVIGLVTFYVAMHL